MIVKCFGTAGYHPSEDRHTSCYYLPDASLLLDAGTGIFRLTEELLKNPRESIDILLSHAHLDHVMGLTFLLDTMAVTKLKNVRVIGEATKLQAIREHVYDPLIFPVPPNLEFVTLPPNKQRFKLASANAFLTDWIPLEHPGGSMGYVIEVGSRRLAYITDTTARPNSPYLAEIYNLDLLIHECNFGDAHTELAEMTGHSWLSAVTEIVRRCRPAKTLLVHHNPVSKLLGDELALNAEQIAPNMQLAHDGDAVEF